MRPDAVVDNNGVADGIEGVRPLLLDGFDLLEKIHIFNGGSKEIGDVYEISEFVLVKTLAGQHADAEHADWAFLAAKRHGNQPGNSGFRHLPADFDVLLFLEARDTVVLPQDFLNPGAVQIEAFVLLQVVFGVAHRGPGHEFRGIALALEQAEYPVARIEAGGDLQQHLLQQFLEGDRLAAGGRQHGELLHLLADFFGALACRLQEQHDHPNAQAGIQEMVERKAEQVHFLLSPRGPVEAVQTQQRESARQQFGAVTAGGTSRRAIAATRLPGKWRSPRSRFPSALRRSG